MEKASDVYNKLKLRFVGKAEVAAKPKTENKEPENDEEKETENTGKSTRFGFTKIWILLFSSALSLGLSARLFKSDFAVSRFHTCEWGIRAEKK